MTITGQIAITITPTAAQVMEGQTAQFSASVSGTANTGVLWSVSGTGCAGSGCGTISSTGLYTAPSSVPAAVIVTATSRANQAIAAIARVTIVPPVEVSVSPASAVVAVGTQQAFVASVINSGNTAVTWSLSGPGCSGAGCGSITASGIYTAPARLPSSPAVTVTATSQAMATAFGTAKISLVGSNNSKLAGQYAFSFLGYDKFGSWLIAGSFVADGNGKITSGQEDVNNMSGATSSLLSGTYQITSDNRGTLTLQTALGSFTYKLALNSGGGRGRLISFDDSGVRGSGEMEKQNPADFDPSVFANGYVIALSGEDSSSQRVSGLSLIFPDGSGFVSGSSFDINDAGTVFSTYSPDSGFLPFSGYYTVDASGRGTISLMVPGLPGALDLAFYVVSDRKFFVVSTDAILPGGMILAGSAQLQNSQFYDASAFNGPSVFALTGRTGAGPHDYAGRFLFDGTSQVSLKYAENNAGALMASGSMKGPYAVQANGRATMMFNVSQSTIIWILYATGPNQGFLMDGSTPAAGLGPVIVQMAGPFDNSNLEGTWLMAPDDPVGQQASLISGIATFDGGTNMNGNGVMSGVVDVSSIAGLSADQVLAATYNVSATSNNGRGSLVLTSPSGESIALWMANPSQVLGVDLTAGDKQPAILHFEQ